MIEYIKWIGISIIIVVAGIFTYLSFGKGEGFADIGTLLILGFTLIALIFYAASTHEIADVDKRTYEEGKLPVVSLTISPKPNTQENYDTRVKLLNLSNYNLEAFVNLNLKVNGKPIEHSPAYSGKQAWFLTAHQRINGHFHITDVLSKAGTNVGEMEANRFYSPGNVKNQLSMCIEVCYRGMTREVFPPNTWPHESSKSKYKDSFTKILANPVQKWYFNFSINSWVYDI